MTPLTCITKGKAFIVPEGLRCGGPRKKDPDLKCNKLLCKKAASGQIAGNFLCERCGQEIEVTLKEASTPSR
jgi:hypothetical protein